MNLLIKLKEFFNKKEVVVKKEREVLRKATIEDAQFLLDSRNNSRTWFLNPKVVSMEEHLHWLGYHIKKPHFYICEVDGKPMGSVRAKRIGGGWELHWETLPEYQGKGYATLFATQLVSLLKGRLVAEIKPDNLASIKVAQALGMSQKSKLKWER